MRLLLLAGTGEARALGPALAAMPGIDAMASLAGLTRTPEPLGIDTRVGGFGGRAAFAAWLSAQRIDAVLDATHPFAAQMSHRATEVCAATGRAHCRLLRPPWRPGPGDLWHEVAAEEEVGRLIPAGATVFLATGRQGLERFAGLGRQALICRRIDPPEEPFPLPGGRYLVGRPPFTRAAETQLFQKLGIDWLVVKNAGGAASRAKLDAARALGLPVAMIARPPPPAAARRVETVEAALGWVRGLA